MKKGWLGIGLLTVFLLVGVWVSFRMDRMHLETERLLQEAVQVSMTGDLSRGIELAEQAQRLWSGGKGFTAAVADHSPMDEIDSLFRELWIYGETEEIPHFAATCAELSFRVRAMADNHRLSWQSFL